MRLRREDTVRLANKILLVEQEVMRALAHPSLAAV